MNFDVGKFSNKLEPLFKKFELEVQQKLLQDLLDFIEEEEDTLTLDRLKGFIWVKVAEIECTRV